MSYSDTNKIGSFNQYLFLNPEMELRINIPSFIGIYKETGKKTLRGCPDCEADLSTAAIFRPTSSSFGKPHRCQTYPNFFNVHLRCSVYVASKLCESHTRVYPRGNVAYGRVRCLENCALWLVLVNRMSEERRVSCP